MRSIQDIINPWYSPAEENIKKGFLLFQISPIQNYEVSGFYLDFAFPKSMVGIEIDGQAYHQDTAKDMKRQKIIERKGWHIHRFVAKTALEYPYLIPAYIYLKYFNKKPDLIKLAQEQMLLFNMPYATDSERKVIVENI